VKSAEAEFVAFAEVAAPRLRRTAFMLCGDWHPAEDLTQTALAKVFVAWRRISRPDAAHAYAQRTLLNTFLADRRLKRPAEVLMSRLPERTGRSAEPEQRLAVLAALATLTPKARAVVVLRYWVDLSVEQVADVLGCSAGNVKSQSARALDKLRPLLSDGAPGAAGQAAGIAPTRRGTEEEDRSSGHG
jgi:RNA polymerase sigma-70 factor (sigma-E family)